jgi:hypothetical protein
MMQLRKKLSLIVLSVFLLGLNLRLPLEVQAQRTTPTPTPLSSPFSATSSATASESAATATPSAEVIQKIQEKKDQDITDTGGQKKSKLSAYLDENPIEPNITNVLQQAIRSAINRGLPANIVVLVLLFPVIASLISFSRHIIGMKGFGIYIPAVLSVAFVSTGIINGILLFLLVLAAATLTRRAVKRLNLQYLPRTAMLFWGVSVVMILTLVGFSFLPTTIPLNFLAGLNIFPLLIIILLTENFMESQLSSSQSAAVRLTVETLITALFCSIIIASEPIQRWVMLQPELTLLIVAAFNILVGRYTGLRLLEWIRFRSIIDE